MKAQVLDQPDAVENNPLHLREVERPTPGAGEILVRVRACGVCHTDLHVVEGELPNPKLPIIPGHEIVGVVEALGAGATRFKVGRPRGHPLAALDRSDLYLLPARAGKPV